MHDAPGPKRANPYGTVGPARLVRQRQEPQSTQTPEQVLHAWTLKLHTVLPEHPKVQKWLEQLAHGTTSHEGADEAFNLLIREEAFDVFAKVFQAYNDIRQDESDHAGPGTFKTTLRLRLPANWAPDLVAQTRMLEVFKELEVQRVEVVCGPPPAPFMPAPPIPAAVCLGIAALLQGGTTELAISGELALPDAVADAIARSALVSIDLMPKTDVTLLSDATLASFRTLFLSGLVHCPTFTHLSLGHKALLPLLPVAAQFSQPSGPALASVTLDMGAGDGFRNSVGPGQVVKQFMGVVNTFPRLSAFTANISENNLVHWAPIFLDPLNGHTSLTKLHIGNIRSPQFDADHVDMFPKVIAFAMTCPSLTHLALTADRVESQGVPLARNLQRRLQGLVTQPAVLAAITAFLASPTCPLQSFVFNGLFLVPDASRVFARALAQNKSLQELDLSHNYIDWQALIDFNEAMETNETLHTAKLPKKDNGAQAPRFSEAWSMSGGYYLQSDDGLVFALAEPANPIPGHLVLDFDDGRDRVDQATRNRAQRKYDELKEPGHAALALLPVKVARNRRGDFPSLVTNVQAFMSTAMASAPRNGADLTGKEGLFGLAASTIVEMLGQQQSLSTGAQLSQLNRAVHAFQQGRKEPDGTPSSQALRSLIKMDNQHNHAYPRQLPTLDEVVNQKNSMGANVQLLKAIEAEDVDLVYTLMARRAVDFGGHARAAAGSSSALLKALDHRPGDETRTTMNSTTTTTTTATTTTTTTTTTGTVVAVDPLATTNASGSTPGSV